jgi:hypothetical protein
MIEQAQIILGWQEGYLSVYLYKHVIFNIFTALK